eukprot:7384951-Prymnesium_polylepis.1
MERRFVGPPIVDKLAAAAVAILQEVVEGEATVEQAAGVRRVDATLRQRHVHRAGRRAHRLRRERLVHDRRHLLDARRARRAAAEPDPQTFERSALHDRLTVAQQHVAVLCPARGHLGGRRAWHSELAHMRRPEFELVQPSRVGKAGREGRNRRARADGDGAPQLEYSCHGAATKNAQVPGS